MNKLIVALIMCLASNALASESVAGESRFADLDGLKVHYTNYGEVDATVVFVHGWACDETAWSEQAAPIAEQTVRTITIDLPGHGRSDKPEIAYTMHLYARAIDAVLRDAKVEKAVLVGHSNGTPVIRQFYREHPASVRGLIIVDGALQPLFDATTLKKFIGPMRGTDYPKIAGGFIDNMTKPISSEELRARIKTMMLRTPQHVAVSELENSADPAIWKPDHIEVPTLMILAKQPGWTEETERFAHSLIPHLDYQVWDNVSHFIMMEKPNEFNAAVMNFLHSNLIVPERS